MHFKPLSDCHLRTETLHISSLILITNILPGIKSHAEYQDIKRANDIHENYSNGGRIQFVKITAYSLKKRIINSNSVSKNNVHVVHEVQGK